MNLMGSLKAYDFINFKLGSKDPQGKSIADVMEEVPRNSENHILMKAKIDKELGFDRKKQRGISYPTLIKYLALALDDMHKKETNN